MSLSNDQIIEEIDNMEKEAKALKDDVLRICWYMRGSISYNDGMLLSQSDKDIINKIIKDNLDTTQKSGMPFF